MIDRNSTLHESNETILLIKDKSIFRKELIDRVKKGGVIIDNVQSIKSGYYQTFDEFNSWSEYNIDFLDQSFNISVNKYMLAYEKVGVDLFELIENNKSLSKHKLLLNLVQLIKLKIIFLNNLKEKISLLKTELEPMKNDNNKPNMKEVFIVHGHDDVAKLETARFIEKIGLRPIILHEQASSGKTIIEKIEEYSNVGFGIVLYTPCDVGTVKNKKNQLNPRARQNVVFEHGYLIGKIGRRNVCALVKDNVEIPNDISGVVYISMNGDWRIKLAQELQNSNYSFDMNKLYK